MDEQVTKNLSMYFSYFYKLSQKWKIITEKVDKPLSGLKNQAEQLTHVEKAEIEEFTNFPDVKERLIFKVLVGIDEELTNLKTILNELNSAVQELKNKLNILDKSTMNTDWDNPSAVSGSALHPPLSEMLQLAYTGWRIYNDMYQNSANILKSVDVRNRRTLDKIKFSFTDTEEKSINEIIALTQYCYTDS